MSVYLHACRWLLLTVTLGGHANAAERSIYRCVETGVTTFSDRPCGTSTQVYSYEAASPALSAAATPSAASSLPAASTMSAAPAQAKPRANPKAAPQRRPRQERAENKGNGHEANCERITVRLEQLRARMRAGYGVAEGERLRDQQRAAKERARQLRCG